MKISFCYDCKRVFRGKDIADSGKCPVCGKPLADQADVKSILAERKRRTNLASATRYREEHREEIRARNLPHAIKRTMDYVASKESLDVPMYCDAASIAVRGIKIRDVYVDATGNFI